MLLNMMLQNIISWEFQDHSIFNLNKLCGLALFFVKKFNLIFLN